MMRQISANGLMLPVLGQGGWYLGDNFQTRKTEMQAIRLGIALGMNLIDTAEMYGEGRSETLIGEAIKGIPRDDYMLVSKVYPHHADKRNLVISCENSLQRLGVDTIDLYLLHWRGNVPLEQTVSGMETLVKQGKIKRWGVSNFDVSDMEDLWRVENGSNCAANQVLYHLDSRGIEFDLIPWTKAHNVAIMAYCPLAQGGTLRRMHPDILNDSTLLRMSEKYHITVMQLLLAFTLRQENVCAIPKAGKPEHVEANAAVADIVVDESDWEIIDAVFWPPTSKMHLDIE